jgi:hypothetical protein
MNSVTFAQRIWGFFIPSLSPNDSGSKHGIDIERVHDPKPSTKVHNFSDSIIGDSENATPLDIPVLIVGGGPTGLLLAYLLNRLGGTHNFCLVMKRLFHR